MWTLSGFIDEISKDFAQQCEVAASLGLRYVELRKAWGINILDLDEKQLDLAAELLGGHGLPVSTSGTSMPWADSGPELFTASWKAFTDISNTEEISYA